MLVMKQTQFMQNPSTDVWKDIDDGQLKCLRLPNVYTNFIVIIII